ncbi:MAG: zf-HC2 domain-containing protein, partial [bacterium]|nr:zf-HC2 domain-containing protein [bacterium]
MGDTNTSHPDRAQLDSFVHGRLEYAQQLQIERHVENCDDCREVLRSIPHDEFVEQMRSSAKRPPSDAANSGKMASVPPELVDHPRYKIIGQIGAGGMGVVYRAEHRIMERSVALKVINSKLVESEDAIERFRLEVKAAARLSH